VGLLTQFLAILETKLSKPSTKISLIVQYKKKFFLFFFYVFFFF
jgi:hypothetical protein